MSVTIGLHKNALMQLVEAAANLANQKMYFADHLITRQTPANAPDYRATAPAAAAEQQRQQQQR